MEYNPKANNEVYTEWSMGFYPVDNVTYEGYSNKIKILDESFTLPEYSKVIQNAGQDSPYKKSKNFVSDCYIKGKAKGVMTWDYIKDLSPFLRNKSKTVTFSVILMVLVNALFQSCSSEKMENVHNNYFIKKNANTNDFKNGYSQSLFIKDKQGIFFMLVKYVSSEIYFNNEKALLLSNINIQGKNYRRLVLCNSNTIIAKDITDELALKYTGKSKFGLINEVLKIDKTKDNKIIINFMGEGMNDDPVVEFFW